MRNRYCVPGIPDGSNILGEQAGFGEIASTVYLGPATKAGLKGEDLGNYVANTALHESWHDMTNITDQAIFRPANWNPKPGTIMARLRDVKELALPLQFSASDQLSLLEALRDGLRKLDSVISGKRSYN